MRILGENEEPLSPEEIERQKKLVGDLYRKEKEEREKYLKSTEEERKKIFEEAKEQISDVIDEKSFRISRQKETAAQLKELHPDLEGTAEKIEKSERYIGIALMRVKDEINKPNKIILPWEIGGMK